jgi:hypothetical protein
MSNLRLLPILLMIGLSLTAIGCQSDEPDPADSIVPQTTTGQPDPTRSADATTETRDTNQPKDKTDETEDGDSEKEEEEEDEFADGNYGEVDPDNTYRPRNTEFEVTLPSQYDIQPQRDGVAFISSDGGFGGEVVFFEEEEPLDADDLEDALKEIYDELLDGASWQLSEIQPDGSVRLDWRGTTPEGKELDAVSYIEQRNDTVFILNVYGIDRPYDAFLDDSQTIIGSYLTWPDDDGGDDEFDNADEFDDADDAAVDDADREADDSRVGAP